MVNRSENQTSVNTSVTRSYIFLPDYALIAKIVIYTLNAILCFYAIAANTLILYFKKNQRSQKSQWTQKAFDRFPLITMYVQSLALSDLLCGVITLPIAITTNFVDFINNNLICKAVRFSNIFFVVVTINNLFVIGIERYIAVFHPYIVPPKRWVKGFVVGAWIAGGLVTLVPSATFTVQIKDIGPDSYTKICIYDKTVQVYKGMFLGFTIIVYFIPSIIMAFTSIRILSFLRRRAKITFPNGSNRGSSPFYGTNAFVSMILTFVIPYLLYLSFTALNFFLKINLNVTEEYVVRRITGMLAYSNAALSPTLMFYNMPDLRRDFLKFVRLLLPNAGHSEDGISKVDNKSVCNRQSNMSVIASADVGTALHRNIETAF